MILKSFTLQTEMIKEVRELVAANITDMNSDKIINCAFYKQMQKEKSLTIYSNKELPEFFLLVARIAATSPKLEDVNLCDLNLFNKAIEIAEVLAKAPNLHSVDLSYNNLAMHGPDTAEVLAKAPNLHSVDLRNNKLGEYGFITAKVLKEKDGCNLQFMNMSTNQLSDSSMNEIKQMFDACNNDLAIKVALWTLGMSDPSNPYLPTDVIKLIASDCAYFHTKFEV